MVSKENLKFLRERGGRYIVGTPKQKLWCVETTGGSDGQPNGEIVGVGEVQPF